MTREEIVEGLKLLEDNMVHFDELQNDKGEWIDVHELLFEAIQALSQEPCEDAISRQAAIDGLASIAKVKARSDAQKSLMGRVMFFTEHLPSVTQKSGKWIKQTLSVKPFGEDTVLCDQCAFMTDRDSMYNYCPNCGAKMESEGV